MPDEIFEIETDDGEIKTVIEEPDIPEPVEMESVVSPLKVELVFDEPLIKTWMEKSWARQRGVYGRVFVDPAGIPMPGDEPEQFFPIIAKFVALSVRNKGIVIVPEELSTMVFPGLEPIESEEEGFLFYQKV